MNKLRKEILTKLAQTTPAAPTTPNKVIPAPPSFIASNVFPSLTSGYNPASIIIINNLMSLLNTALQYASGGSVNLQTFRNNNFNVDPGSAPSPDQKNLTILAKMAYNLFLNKGNPFGKLLAGKQISIFVDQILASPAFQNLSQINPTGPLATKIQGNLKTIIQDNLTHLKNINPVTQ
jgi:hypothetical protein